MCQCRSVDINEEAENPVLERVVPLPKKSDSDKEKSIFHSLYVKFCELVNSSKKDSPILSIFSNQSTGSKHCTNHCRAKKNLSNLKGDIRYSDGHDTFRVPYHASFSSDESDFSSMLASYSSASSSLTFTSNSTTTSDCCTMYEKFKCDNGSYGDFALMDTGIGNDLDATDGENSFFDPQPRARTQRLTPRITKFFSLNLPDNAVRIPFFATWPLTSSRYHELCSHDTSEGDAEDKDRLQPETNCDPVDDATSHIDQRLRESLGDWIIPYTDVKILKRLRSGHKFDIHEGRWHGDVLVYLFHHLNNNETSEFLKDVSRLSKIRHENVCLFMGACVDSPNLAVITSGVKGSSLYEKIHLQMDKVSMQGRVNILRQVSQAMGYLHAKSVIVRQLTSRNIYLESKVKLCLLDQTSFTLTKNKSDCIGVPRGTFCYCAPEVLKTMRIVPSVLHFSEPLTYSTDVFAFGTLLYELITCQYPYRGNVAEEVVMLICTGRLPGLGHLCCNSALKILIERCWSTNPKRRPSFTEINQELQLKTGLHKRHSSSHPDYLNVVRYTKLTSQKRLC